MILKLKFAELKLQIAEERLQHANDLQENIDRVSNEKDDYYSELLQQVEHDAYWTGALQGSALTATAMAILAFCFSMAK